MQTNYAGHEAQYQRRKTLGFSGWETADGAAKNLVHFAKVFSCERVPRSGKLLELGCGAGDISLWLAERGYDVYGVDIAPSAIEWAREKASERNVSARFSLGDVRDLNEFEEDFFDIVLDGRCLHCIIGDDRAKFLSAAKRVLRPGGFLHLDIMCNDPISEGLKQNFDPITRCQVFGDVAIRYCGLAEDIIAEVQKSGFEILHWQVIPSEDQNSEELLVIDAVKP